MTIPIFNTKIGIMNTNFQYIRREIETSILEHLHHQKVIILYGARQVGKTTLLHNLFRAEKTVLYLSCEQSRIQEQLIPDSLALQKVIGNYPVIILDEAQYLDNPGLILKILIDNFPERSILASGSSAFDLAHKISEPLTGRHYRFLLHPLSISEITQQVLPVDIQFHLKQALLFGTYPEVFSLTSQTEKINNLSILADAYLYKDVLAFNLVKNSRKVRELLIALALQIGNEVSYSELANIISVDRKTVEHYLDLLEKSFVAFRLYGFSRNLRNEIGKKVKIYFYDLGIRNTLVNNFNELSIRNDGGAMFENFVVSEMMKKDANAPQRTNFYFWRTYDQKEIDLVTEKNGMITAYEIKLHSSQKVNQFSKFQSIYPQSQIKLITSENLLEILHG